MRFVTNYFLKYLFLSAALLLLPGRVLSNGWFPVYENPAFGPVNDAVFTNFHFDTIYAVGQNGFVHISTDFGNSWQQTSSGSSAHLKSIVAAWDWDADQPVVWAVGDAGTALRADVTTNLWFPADSLEQVDYNKVYYDNYSEYMWIGGENSTVYYSVDLGRTWKQASLPVRGLSVRAFGSSYEGITAYGFRNDTTFAVQLSVGSPVLRAASGDTLPGFEITGAWLLDQFEVPEIILMGRTLDGGLTQLWRLNLNVFSQTKAVLLFSGDLGDATDIDGINEFNYSKWWITNRQGQVWESVDGGFNWQRIFTDEQGRALTKILSNGFDRKLLRIFGDGGLVLKYGFEVTELFPAPNQHVISSGHPAFRFSLVPDLDSLLFGITVRSNITGSVPFTADYQQNPPDSQMVVLQINRLQNGGIVPGERWNISFSDRLVPLGISNPDPFNAFNYNCRFLPLNGSGFGFRRKTDLPRISKLSTNFVQGFFNGDDTFDLAAYSDDSLFFFTDLSTENPPAKVVLFSGQGPGIDAGLPEQMVTLDFNNDGRLDILLFDRDNIWLMANRSDGPDFAFDQPLLVLRATNIRQVIPYNANNNSRPDLLVLASDLRTIYDIDPLSGQPAFQIVHRADAGNMARIEAADVDNDTNTDLIFQDVEGSLLFWPGENFGAGYTEFYESGIVFVDQQIYNGFTVADLDEDRLLEIVAYDSVAINGFMLARDGAVLFTRFPVLTAAVSNSSGIKDILIEDIGGPVQDNSSARLDLAVLTGDSLFVLENATLTPGEYAFRMRAESGQHVAIAGSQLLGADHNKDGLIDITIIDRSNGAIDLLEKYSWQPTLELLDIKNESVSLQWTPLPETEGTAQFYRVWRDSSPDFDHTPVSWQVNASTFTDTSVWKFQTYWYAVQAVYQDGRESLLSLPVQADIFFELNGDLSGVISDSTRPYLVRQPVRVAQGQQLDILGHIEIGFVDSAGMDVYGTLNVAGSTMDHMVDFHGLNSGDLLWPGIHIFGGTDTISFRWFSLYGAQAGLTIEDRPAVLTLGGLSGCGTGLSYRGDSLSVTNVIADSNGVGMQIGSAARAEIRNVNIINNQQYSLIIGDEARVRLRNAIIWANGMPLLIDGGSLALAYSVVDSVEGPYQQKELSRLEPLFLPPDSGFYRPARLSPTIDGGDPADDFSQEPQPNGGRINVGLYGGTSLASPTYQARIAVNEHTLFMETQPGFTDTARLVIYNRGTVVLELLDMRLKKGIEQFTVQATDNPKIAPADSLEVPVYFNPDIRAEFADTLQILTNDPHLEKGLKSVPVFGWGLNSSPQIMGEPPRLAHVGQLYQYRIEAIDADGDSLIYTPLQLPAWLTLSDSGRISGTPALSDTGLAEVQVAVSDLFEGTAMLEYQILVTRVQEVVTVPVITLQPLSAKVLTQDAVRFTFSVSDSIISGDPGMSVQPSPYRIRYVLRQESAGTEPLISDTTAIDRLEFYPLKDGVYTFRIWAYNENRIGFNGLYSRETRFSVLAAKKNLLPLRWHMTAFPRPYSMNWSELGQPDSLAALFSWNATEEEYQIVNRKEIGPGEAFWMLAAKQLRFDFNDLAYNPDDYVGEKLLRRQIKKGWNQVGVPLGYSVYWQECRFVTADMTRLLSWQEAVADSLIEPQVYWFINKGDFQGYEWTEVDSSKTIWPWTGYWLRANADAILIFSTRPAFDSGTELITDYGTDGHLSKGGTGPGWSITLGLDNGAYFDTRNILGMGQDQSARVLEPPHFGEYCSLYFPENRRRLTKLIKDDFSSFEDVRTWNMNVESQTEQLDHTIYWDTKELNGRAVYLYLVDLQREQIIKMNKETSYSFKPAGGTYRFQIYAALDESFTPELVPLSYKLEQNFPNPFNPLTTIRFGLPVSSQGIRTSLRIFDVLGKEVKTLFDGQLKSGYHEFEWDGTNQTGQAVASGIYFYQLHSGKETLIRKMILVR